MMESKLEDAEGLELVISYSEACNWVAFFAFDEPTEPVKLYTLYARSANLEEEGEYLRGRYELGVEQLTGYLLRGEIRCYGLKAIFDEEAGDFARPIADFENVPIEVLETGDWDEYWDDDDLRDGDVIQCFEKVAFIGVHINWSDLQRFFPDRKDTDRQDRDDSLGHLTKSFSTKPERRGRKAKYDWETFLTELIVRADLDGIPDKQADLEKDMAEWCLDKWGEEPSTSMIRKRISKIYNHYRKKEV